MKQAVFIGDGKVNIAQVADPKPGKDEVVIKVHACGICGSDKEGFQKGSPLVMGHEVSGTIVDTGEDTAVPLGQRIVSYIAGYCGTCRYCQKGYTNMCRNITGVYGFDFPGGYAEYMVLPEKNVIPLAPEVSFDEAVILLDVLGTTCHALRRIGLEDIKTALVVGCGPIGLGTIVSLKAFGIREIYGVEKSDFRLTAAASLGAKPVDVRSKSIEEICRKNMPYGFDLVVEASGEHDPISQALHACAPFGKVLILGEFWGRINIKPTLDLVHKDFSVARSWYFPFPEFEENQQLVLEGAVNPEALLGDSYSLEDIKKGFEDFIAGKTLKALVKPFM